MAKPKVKEVIVVEGRYDKNTLSQVVDAVIVELGGFAVFNDKEKQAFLRKLAKERGIILFTDPDGAGFVIRNRVKGNIPEGRVLQAYVPDIYGKEKRKRKGGKEGKLGVEGMKPEILEEALRRAGAVCDTETRGRVTKADLAALGLSGGADRAGVTLLAARLAEGVAGIEYDDDRPDPGEYDIAFTADVGVQEGGR